MFDNRISPHTADLENEIWLTISPLIPKSSLWYSRALAVWGGYHKVIYSNAERAIEIMDFPLAISYAHVADARAATARRDNVGVRMDSSREEGPIF